MVTQPDSQQNSSDPTNQPPATSTPKATESASEVQTSEDGKDVQTQLYSFILELGEKDREKREDDMKTLGSLLDKMDKSQTEAQDPPDDDGYNKILLMATENGLLDVVEELLKRKADVLIRGNFLRQHLHAVCREGDKQFAELLLKYDADVEDKTSDGSSPLLSACWGGHSEVVTILLAHDANTQMTDNNGCSPLFVASRWGCEKKVVDLLLAKNCSNINEAENGSNGTPLHGALWSHSPEIVETLLESGAKLDAKDIDGWTPLMTATRYQDEDMMKSFIKFSKENHIQLEMVDESGNTPLLIATRNGFTRGVQILADAGANCNAIDPDSKRTALMFASTDGYEKIVEDLIQAKVPADATMADNDGETALMAACSNRHLKIVQLLLGHESGVSSKKKEVERVLHEESGKGSKEAVKTEKRLVDAKDNEGWTALHYACEAIGGTDENSQTEENTDDTSNREKEESMPQQGRQAAVVELLLRSGASVAARTNGGETALHLAAKCYNQEIFKLILEEIKGKDGSEPPPWDGSYRDALYQAFREENRDDILRKLVMLNKRKNTDFCCDDVEREALLRAASTPKLYETAKQLFSGSRVNMIEPTFFDLNNGKEWTLIEWAVVGAMPDVLWMFIAMSARTTQIEKRLESALKLAELARNSEDKARDSARHEEKDKPDISTVPRQPNRKDKMASKGGGQDTDRQQKPPPDRLALIRDILKDPPFAQMHKDAYTYELPQFASSLTKTLNSLDAAVIQFYKGSDQSGTMRRFRKVREVVYDPGPALITIDTMKMLNDIIPAEPTAHDSTFSRMYFHDEPKFKWVHLPSTNMVWMNDLLKMIMKTEKYDTHQFRGVSSFFRDSWEQVPDKTSPSRIMRPRFRERIEKTNTKETEAGKCEHEQPFIPASAIYMPYLSFSVQFQEKSTTGKVRSTTKDRIYEKLLSAKKNYDEVLLNYHGEPVHGSLTIDEWYYQFASNGDDGEQRRRNETQVVTKSLREQGEEPKPQWLLLRVNQLWVWTFGNKWLITATTHRIDDSKDTFVEDILDYLGKRVEAEGSQVQPGSVIEMSQFIVDYCVGSYERKPNDHERMNTEKCNLKNELSIRQIFSNYINKTGQNETTLFDEFKNQVDRRGRELDKTLESDQDVNEGLNTSVQRTHELWCDIKDIRDELNILKSVADYQDDVQSKLLNKELSQLTQTNTRAIKADTTAGYVLRFLNEMDKTAERIQSNASTTLSLQQSDAANLQASQSVKQGQEAMRQSKTLMVFTQVTILFSPLSFLSSLFALDFAPFKPTRVWTLVVIFVVSFVFSALLGLYAARLDEVKNLVLMVLGKKKAKGSQGEGEVESDNSSNESGSDSKSAQDGSTNQAVPSSQKEFPAAGSEQDNSENLGRSRNIGTKQKTISSMSILSGRQLTEPQDEEKGRQSGQTFD